MELKVDLFSDTISRPTRAMREAMMDAPVGDEQKREDPTTSALERRCAELLGKEAAVFLPSGTMANQIAVRVHCQQGEEIILDESYHLRNFEAGGVAALSGVQLHTIRGERGMFTPAQVEAAVRSTAIYHLPVTRMLSLEQTTNMGGGGVWPIDQMRAVSDKAREHGLVVHMDGARLMNAVVKSGVSARDYAGCCDTLWIDFSKGLGAPVGAALAGTQEFIDKAWRFKHQFGGALRQSGIVSAAALYALDHNIERIADDHDNAKALAEGLRGIEGLAVEEPETNMVFFDVAGLGMTAQSFISACTGRGVRFSGGAGPSRVRAVTYINIDREGIHLAIDTVKSLAEERLAATT